jgi:hypothetical protein
MKIRYDALLIFRGILDTAEICIGLIWHGLYTQRAEVFRNKKSRTKYFMRVTSQRKAAPRGSSTMRNVPRSRRSAWSSRYLNAQLRYPRGDRDIERAGVPSRHPNTCEPKVLKDEEVNHDERNSEKAGGAGNRCR